MDIFANSMNMKSLLSYTLTKISSSNTTWKKVMSNSGYFINRVLMKLMQGKNYSKVPS